MFRLTHFVALQFNRWRLSLFEKVILANSIMLIGEALAGLWVTSHNIEAHHYLIDTSFIIAATLLGLLINVLLLRASFRPLFHLLSTIRAVSRGKTRERAHIMQSDTEMSELAQAFNAMLDRLEATRREQAMLILQAQEEECRRLALELHDESSQNLTALLVHIEVLNQSLQALAETTIANAARAQLEGGLHNLTMLTQHTLENVRTLAQQLRPTVLDDLGLRAAFRWLAEDGRQRLHLDIALQIEGIEDTSRKEQRQGAFSPSTLYEIALFRIAQESLTNVARHAHAQHVSISLVQEPDQICLQVRDDGCGCALLLDKERNFGQEQKNDPVPHRAGLGIFGMRERAALLGGTINIQSQPGQGTTVEALLPIPSLPIEKAEKVAYA